MARHPRLKMRVESHTGVGAPPSIAPEHSVRRALTLLQQLSADGVALERISVNAWGMDVGLAQVSLKSPRTPTPVSLKVTY